MLRRRRGRAALLAPDSGKCDPITALWVPAAPADRRNASDNLLCAPRGSPLGPRPPRGHAQRRFKRRVSPHTLSLYHFMLSIPPGERYGPSGGYVRKHPHPQIRPLYPGWLPAA